MARILDTRVIYGVRKGFFNGKTPMFPPGPPPLFDASDYEENRILLLVNPQNQTQVTAKIYIIPAAKQKGFDLITIDDINNEKDEKGEKAKNPEKLKKAIDYINQLDAKYVGEIELKTDDKQRHQNLVASATEAAQETKLENHLNDSIFGSNKNINLKVLGVGVAKVSASGLKRIQRISGIGGADFHFKDMKGEIIPNFKFSYKHKSQNSFFERYKGFIAYLKIKIKTNKPSVLSEKFKEFYHKAVRYYSYASLSNTMLGQVYEKIGLSDEAIKEEFRQFLYGIPGTPDHYDFILISNTEPKFEIDSESSNDNSITYILKNDSDQVVYVYPEIPEGVFTPCLVARPGPHGTKVELLSHKDEVLESIISDIRFFISPERRASRGKNIDSGLLEILETIPKELNHADLEKKIKELININFVHASEEIEVDKSRVAVGSMQEQQETNLHIITELRCLYYSLFE